MYSDGCVAPNENSLPHPFLDDNGIDPVYQKDKHEMKVSRVHHRWISGALLAAGFVYSVLLHQHHYSIITEQTRGREDGDAPALSEQGL